MKIMWICEITLFSHFVHMIFILFSHFGARNPGPGPGPRPQHVKFIWKTYENNVIANFHIIFAFISYYFHICVTFWGSGPGSGHQKSYLCHILGHMIFIWFSYFCENLVVWPVHTDSLYKAWRNNDYYCFGWIAMDVHGFCYACSI